MAAAKYVTTTGAGGHNGTSLGNAWNMAEANAAADDGDVVFIQSGDYSTGIDPANAGSS